MDDSKKSWKAPRPQKEALIEHKIFGFALNGVSKLLDDAKKSWKVPRPQKQALVGHKIFGFSLKGVSKALDGLCLFRIWVRSNSSGGLEYIVCWVICIV